MKSRFLYIIIFLCSVQQSLHGIDWWTAGLTLAQPFLNVFAQRIFAKDQKTEKDRVNESLAIQVAILNSPNVPPELKKSALNAILRYEQEARSLDIKDYLESADLKKEDKDLVEWAQKEVRESSRKILLLSQDIV